MFAPSPPTRFGASAFLAEARPLVAAVHAALADWSAETGTDAAGRFLAAAPVDECVRLAELWAAAGPSGPRGRERLPLDDQVILDMVTATYSVARPDSHPDLSLGDLIDDPAAGPAR